MASTRSKDTSWQHHSETRSKRNTPGARSSSQNRNTHFQPGSGDFSTESDDWDDEIVLQHSSSRNADVYYKNEPTKLVSIRLPTRIVMNLDKAVAAMNANGFDDVNRTQLIARLLDVPSEMLTRAILRVKR